MENIKMDEETKKQIEEIESECKIYRNGDFYSFDFVKFGNEVLKLIEDN